MSVRLQGVLYVLLDSRMNRHWDPCNLRRVTYTPYICTFFMGLLVGGLRTTGEMPRFFAGQSALQRHAVVFAFLSSDDAAVGRLPQREGALKVRRASRHLVAEKEKGYEQRNALKRMGIQLASDCGYSF